MPEAPDPADTGGVQPGEPGQNGDNELVRGPEEAPGSLDAWLTSTGAPRVHWLLIQGPGMATQDLTQALVGRLQAEQIHVTVRTIDDYLGTSHEATRPMNSLKGFSCVLLVLPSAPPPTGRKPPWKVYGEIAKLYRQQLLPAAEAYRPGAGLSQEAGVIQVFHREEDLDFSEVRALIGAACDSHCFTNENPAASVKDVFRVFPSKAARQKLQDEVTGAMLSHWRDVKKWGIDSLERAQVIKRLCDERRQALEDPSKPAMYRPIPGIGKNRLELLLTAPEVRPPVPPDATDDERKEVLRIFRDNGARAVRVLVEDMIKGQPWFHQPAGKEGRKNAQQGFVALYRSLQIVTSGSSS